jgi:DNA-damage-inducible protein J
MTSNALVQTRIDAEVKDRATAVLESMGLTVSDAVRMLLTRIANEGALPFGFSTDPATHDAWFKAKVYEALNDTRPPVLHEQAEEYFAERRSAARKKTPKGKA